MEPDKNNRVTIPTYLREMANINPNCPCKNVGCPRHGNCEECKANHHASGGLTSCERLAKEREGK